MKNQRVGDGGWLAAWLIAGLAAGASAAEVSTPAARGEVFVASYSGIITPVAAEFITEALDAAEAAKAEALVLRLDTPGGLDASMRDIVKAILGAEVPVIAYVAPSGARAASAGAYITLAAHVAAMAPGTNMGAAHPVQLGGGDAKSKPSEVMEAKMGHDAAAYIKAIAARRGRNAELAVQMVSKSTSVAASDALQAGLIDLVAKDLEELLDAADGRKVADFGRSLKTKGAKTRALEMSRRQRLLAAVSDPNVAMILMSLGVSAILIELYNPGLILPGIVGALSLILAFYAFQTLSASYAGVLLMLLGVVLFLLELKVVSYGLLAMGGAASLFFGALMLFRDAGAGVSVAWTVILSTVGTMLAVMGVLVLMAKKALGRKSAVGLESARGQKAKVTADLAPEGQVLWQGELWKARSAGETIAQGAEVVIERVEGLLLIVRR